jgi:hypothetical protein
VFCVVHECCFLIVVGAFFEDLFDFYVRNCGACLSEMRLVLVQAVRNAAESLACGHAIKWRMHSPV